MAEFGIKIYILNYISNYIIKKYFQCFKKNMKV